MKLAADPREVELTIKVGQANFILHSKPMPHGAGDDEPLRVEFRKFRSMKRRRKAVGRAINATSSLPFASRSKLVRQPSSSEISIPGLLP